MKNEMSIPTYIIVSLGILISLTRLGSGLRMFTQPHPFTFLTKKLNITCIADDPADLEKSVISIQIMRHIEDKPIAIVNMREELKMATGIKDNVKAEGHIGIKSNTSYLTLIIDKPEEQDAGPYRCQMFFIDENFKMVEKNVIGNVTYQKQDIIGVVRKLARRVSSLLTTVQEQNTLINKMAKQIDMLNTDNTKKQQQLDMLMDYIRQHNETIQKPENKQTCTDKGWTFYTKDLTCLQVFGKDDGSKRLTWSEARGACKTFGGDLVQIHDDDKNKFVYNMIADSDFWTWIGFKNHATVGFDFKYVDGSPVDTYHPWYPGEPLGDKDGERKCGCMDQDTTNNPGQWGDCLCSASQPYVCSIPSRLVF